MIKKTIFTIFTILLLLFLSFDDAYAADLAVIFGESGCDLDPDAGALFEELDVNPLDSIERTLEITNNSTGPSQLGIEAINFKESGIIYRLSKILNLKVYDADTNEVIDTQIKTIADWKNEQLIVPEVAVGETKTFIFEVSMENEGNNYQEKTLSFDLTFVCEGGVLEDGDVLSNSNKQSPVESVVQAIETIGDILGETVTRLPDTGVSLFVLFPSISLIGLGVYLRKKRK